MLVAATAVLAAGPAALATLSAHAALAEAAPLRPTLSAPLGPVAPLLGVDRASAPPLSEVKAWSASPYRAIGIYLPVPAAYDNRFDKAQANLTVTWVRQVRALGWSILPIFFGYQPPASCISVKDWKMSADPAVARRQGAQAAFDAAGSALALGLPAGSPIYHDFEPYSTGCASAVLAYVDGWDRGLAGLGFVPGVYGARASLMTDLVTKVADPAFALPVAIWVPTNNQQRSVFGLGQPPDRYWAYNQRINQDRLDFRATYGGVTWTIDEDAVDAPVVGPAPVPALPAATRYHPLAPRRLLDTRYGIGAAPGAVGPGGNLVLPVTGGPVPAGASAVALNLTVTQPGVAGWLSVGPAPVLTSSNLNFGAGETIAVLAVSAVSPQGTVTVHNGSGGYVHVVADLQGYFAEASVGSGFHAIAPVRLLDTRYGVGASRGALPAGGDLVLPLTGGAVPADAVAIVLNLTVTQPGAPGWVSIGPVATTTSSNLNFGAGATVANLTMSAVSPRGSVTVHNGSAGSIHLVGDLQGYYRDPDDAGSRFVGLAPVRLLDTRNGTGGPAATLAPSGDLVLHATGGLVPTGATAVVLNVTVVATGPGWISVGPARATETSSVKFTSARVISNLVTTDLSTAGSLTIHNFSAAGVHLVIDASGYYLAP